MSVSPATLGIATHYFRGHPGPLLLAAGIEIVIVFFVIFIRKLK